MKKKEIERRIAELDQMLALLERLLELLETRKRPPRPH